MRTKTVAWTWYHRPDFSWTISRRRTGEELLEMLFTYGEAMVTRGRSLVRPRFRPTTVSNRMVAWRLQKAGLLVVDRGPERPPEVRLADDWVPRDVLRPEDFWRQSWSGIWFVLMYDIAEADRQRRTVLRGWLKRLRMGLLQRSVWISPRDVRAEFHDLLRATGSGLGSCLFESRATVGQSDADLVRTAWDWHTLAEGQNWYLGETGRMIPEAAAGRIPAMACEALAREELAAYHAAMKNDPLLPSALLPAGYLGRQVVEMHRRFVKALQPRLAKT